MRCWWILVVAVGCYAPQAAPGGPCSSDGRCPAGLACEQGLCVVPGTGGAIDAPGISDAAVDGSPDATVTPADAPVVPPDAFVDPTLIAHWKFDDSPANGALDSSGRGHTGTCTACPALVTGKIGMGYQFVAANDHVLRVPDDGDFRGVFTIAGWMRANALGGSLSMLAKAHGTSTGNSWQLEYRDTGTITFSGGSPHTLDGPTIQTQVWYHVAGTWDGTTKRLYLDGALVASAASTVSYDTHMVYLGADENSGSLALPFDGILDDLRVYNRVLPLPEIEALAQ